MLTVYIKLQMRFVVLLNMDYYSEIYPVDMLRQNGTLSTSM